MLRINLLGNKFIKTHSNYIFGVDSSTASVFLALKIQLEFLGIPDLSVSDMSAIYILNSSINV